MKDEQGKQLEQILTVLFTEPENLLPLLEGIDKKILIQCFTTILDRYANDVNSSTLRELITMMIAGYEFKVIGKKLGYNGKTSRGEPCEVKPRNIRSDSGNRLNGGGSFNDLTYERFDKYRKDKAVVLASGFVDGRLLYILQFPFSYSEFSQRIQEQLERHFARGKRAPGQYQRGAQFSFKHYKDCPQLKVIYKEPRLSHFEQYLTRGLFNFLRG